MGMDRREMLRRLAAGAAGAAWAAHAAAPSPSPAPHTIMTRRIPATGETIPVIGLGTWQTFDVGTGAAERAPLEAVLRTFAEHGGRVIDSSPMYGRSEEVVGDLTSRLALQPAPWVATKVWTSGRDAGIRQMEASIRKLRVKALDLMQVHNLLDVDTHLKTLAQWKAEGRVRYVGVTHYTASGAEEIARLVRERPVDFVQINYSVAERAAEERLLPLCRDQGIGVIANRPFAGGGIFGRVRGRPVPEWAGEIGCTSWAQLMLKFVVSHPAITCAIPASAKPEHTRDNMQAGYGALADAKQRERIAQSIERL